MIFLIQYNRKKGAIVLIERFSDFEKAKADKERLQLELRLNNRQIEHEVVLLQANSEEELLRTHGRYFKDLAGLSVLPAH